MMPPYFPLRVGPDFKTALCRFGYHWHRMIQMANDAVSFGAKSQSLYKPPPKTAHGGLSAKLKKSIMPGAAAEWSKF